MRHAKMFALFFCLVLSFCVSVTMPLSGDTGTAQTESKRNLIVPSVRVGEFVLGESTLANILGQDTPEARQRFADKGIWFQFDEGKLLTGVTLRSNRYATVEGLRVGSTADEVITAFGQPRDAKLRLKKGSRAIGEIPAIVYEGITFIAAKGKVTAIQVTVAKRAKADAAPSIEQPTSSLLGLDRRDSSQRTAEKNQAMGVLETFLGALASKDFRTAYELVAPSSKKHGDPIAYNTPLNYKSFLGELSLHVSDDTSADGGLRKFMGYKLGDHRWESPDRFRVLVTFQGWDRDEVLIVREDGKWYVADPIHIIR